MTRQEFVCTGRDLLRGVTPEFVAPELVAWVAIRVWNTDLFFMDCDTAKRFWYAVLGRELMNYLEAE